MKRRPEAARHRIGAKPKVTIQTGAETESVAPPAGRLSARLQPPKSPLERPPGLKFGSPWTRQSASRIPTEPVRVPKQYRQTTDNIDSMPAGLTSRWGWYWVRGFPDPDEPPNVRPQIRASFQGGKTERPNKPAQQMQHARGFIVGCASG